MDLSQAVAKPDFFFDEVKPLSFRLSFLPTVLTFIDVTFAPSWHLTHYSGPNIHHGEYKECIIMIDLCDASGLGPQHPTMRSPRKPQKFRTTRGRAIRRMIFPVYFKYMHRHLTYSTEDKRRSESYANPSITMSVFPLTSPVRLLSRWRVTIELRSYPRSWLIADGTRCA